MKSRQEIKHYARIAMGEQRGTAILVFLIVFLIGLATGLASGMMSGMMLVLSTFGRPNPFMSWAFTYLIMFFVSFPLAVGACDVFIKIYIRYRASANGVFTGFSVNYMRKVGGMAWMYLFTMLWTMLLVVPGIIKSIAYSMTPYILTDCPNVTAKDALKLSMRMTEGHKMDLFVMQLSFFGWWILSFLTCNILGLVFVAPYHATTTAGYYVELRDKAVATGVIHVTELTGRLQ